MSPHFHSLYYNRKTFFDASSNLRIYYSNLVFYYAELSAMISADCEGEKSGAPRQHQESSF